MSGSVVGEMAAHGKIVEVEPTRIPLCPVCGVDLTRHHVSRWYGRRYDVWSDRMANDGMVCVTLYGARLPDEKELLARLKPSRGRRVGAKLGVDFDDPTLRERGRKWIRNAGAALAKKRREVRLRRHRR